MCYFCSTYPPQQTNSPTTLIQDTTMNAYQYLDLAHSIASINANPHYQKSIRPMGKIDDVQVIAIAIMETLIPSWAR